MPTNEFFFGDKVREGLTLVGAFPEGTTVTGSERDSVAKKKITDAYLKEVGLTKISGDSKNCALLIPWRRKVLSTSFSLPIVPWTEYFGCKVTFLRPPIG
jgi:hypothetical protein